MVLALTKLRFSLPYKAARTSVLALLELVARREARSENDSIASVPQAPYASTTMGTLTPLHTLPRDYQLTSNGGALLLPTMKVDSEDKESFFLYK